MSSSLYAITVTSVTEGNRRGWLAGCGHRCTYCVLLTQAYVLCAVDTGVRTVCCGHRCKYYVLWTQVYVLCAVDTGLRTVCVYGVVSGEFAVVKSLQ